MQAPPSRLLHRRYVFANFERARMCELLCVRDCFFSFTIARRGAILKVIFERRIGRIFCLTSAISICVRINARILSREIKQEQAYFRAAELWYNFEFEWKFKQFNTQFENVLLTKTFTLSIKKSIWHLAANVVRGELLYFQTMFRTQCKIEAIIKDISRKISCHRYLLCIDMRRRIILGASARRRSLREHRAQR